VNMTNMRVSTSRFAVNFRVFKAEPPPKNWFSQEYLLHKITVYPAASGKVIPLILSLSENAPFCKKKIVYGVYHTTSTLFNCPKSYIVAYFNAKIKHYHHNVNSRNIAKLGKIYK
ncbi:MAG: hypothetical protein WBL85_11060, partial [Sedimentisphaerales bacterium]